MTEKPSYNERSLRIAGVGGGVAGIAAAFTLQHVHQVTLFESNDYVGGHTHTITIFSGPDAGTPVDTGFIVLNDRTYPVLNRFFTKLGVVIKKSDMSFSYFDERSGFQYASSNIDSLFAQRANLMCPGYWWMLAEILRFNGLVRRMLRENRLEPLTLDDFFKRYRFSSRFRQWYLYPMVAAIWSAPDEALALLVDPDDMERRLLGAWQYSNNETYLHTDLAWMPTNPRAWASWNFIRKTTHDTASPVTLTYHMNRRQRQKTRDPYMVTLNPFTPIDEAKVIAHMTYTHPVFTFKSLGTQSPIPDLNGRRNTYFCGSYFGYGFHEDAVRETGNGRFPAVFTAQKRFHVSPFNNMKDTCTFTFADIRREQDIQIDLHRDGEHVLRAHLRGDGRPLTVLNHLKTLLRHPVRPHLTMNRIYREALKLFWVHKLDFYSKPVPQSAMSIRRPAPNSFQRYCTRRVLEHLAGAKHGRLQLTMPDSETYDFGGADASGLARIKINDHAFFSRVVLGSDIGLGEGYMFDEWDTDDIAGTIGFFIRNRKSLQEGDFKAGLMIRAMEYIRFLRRANTLMGSRRNIGAHYDLSNDFFRIFLDDTMTYSCAIFKDPEEPLELAQQRKYHRIIDKARLKETDHLLEIGCGWGGFAIEAVRQTGCRITGITISKAQYDLARERVRQAGLQHRINIQFTDYRRICGRFDKIVSIEMLEAVGHRYYGTFFRQLDRLLAPKGIAVLQTITIADQRYEKYRRSHDWIQKHIFPGGLIPSLTVLTQAMTRHSAFRIEHLENIGHHYTATLQKWRQRFDDQKAHVRQLGYDRLFQRKWAYYLGFCEAGFRERALGDLQLVLRR